MILRTSKNKTNFQLRVQSYDGLIDFTEHKLRSLLRKTIDNDRRFMLTVLLTDYIKGAVAIAWCNGEPCYVRVAC